MCTLLVLLLGNLLLLGNVANAKPAVVFEEGQVWSFQARSFEPGARFQIITIDRFDGGMVIYHISLSGLQLKNPMTESGTQADLAHLPVQESTLLASVVEKLDVEIEIPPDFAEGYKNFYQDLGAQKAGIWDIPLVEIMERLEESVKDPEKLVTED